MTASEAVEEVLLELQGGRMHIVSVTHFQWRVCVNRTCDNSNVISCSVGEGFWGVSGAVEV